MMTDDKTKLLRSLSIDRSTGQTGRPAARRRWLPIAAGVGVGVLGAFAAFAVYEFRTQDQPKVASQPAAPPQAPQAQQRQAAAGGSESGNLAASGYVVARRKATVAAEITGKVVEVFIDEGMTVADGQVVARLDSVLAEKDTSWRSRASRRRMPRSPRSPPTCRTRRGSCRGCRRCHRRILRPRPS